MYQALYRKYRPIDFNSVVGQDSIIKTLKNSIINHNFSHAYMFFGPRGTGKTTKFLHVILIVVLLLMVSLVISVIVVRHLFQKIV